MFTLNKTELIIQKAILEGRLRIMEESYNLMTQTLKELKEEYPDSATIGGTMVALSMISLQQALVKDELKVIEAVIEQLHTTDPSNVRVVPL